MHSRYEVVPVRAREIDDDFDRLGNTLSII